MLETHGPKPPQLPLLPGWREEWRVRTVWDRRTGDASRVAWLLVGAVAGDPRAPDVRIRAGNVPHKGGVLPQSAAAEARPACCHPSGLPTKLSWMVHSAWTFPRLPQPHNRTVAWVTALAAVTRSLRRTRSSGVGHSL